MRDVVNSAGQEQDDAVNTIDYQAGRKKPSDRNLCSYRSMTLDIR
jgi:hypothetical protein